MDVLDDRESLMIARTEAALRRPLEPEERYEIENWDRGRVLSQVVHTDAWAILLDTLKTYVTGAAEDLLKLEPGDKDVIAAHAAASALNTLYVKFQQDVNNAIRASMQTPLILREAARYNSAVPPDSM